MRSKSLTSLFSRAALTIAAGVSYQQSLAAAQVVYSVGTQEVYDSNIYQEDDRISENTPRTPDGALYEELDGKRNDDIISNPYVSLASRLPLGSKIDASASLRLGAVAYSSNSDESRGTVDGLFTAAPAEGSLPEYILVRFTDTITSQAGGVGVAAGAATRQGQQNTASLQAGLNRYALTDRDAATNLFLVSRQDFLGQFLFTSNDDSRRIDIEGVDSFTYGMTTRYDRMLSDSWTAFLSNNISYFDVTGGSSNNLNSNDLSSDLDRINDTPAVGATFVAGPKLQFTGQTGVDFSRFSTSPQNTEQQSAVTGVTELRDRSQSNFFYGATMAYTASERAVLAVNILQSAGTDIDGDRLMTRTFGANGSYAITDTLSGILSGQLSQFTLGDSLAKPTERYEAVASLRYGLTDAIALSLGYSYVVQDRPQEATAVFFSGGDFEGHRAFVSLDTGFVGLLQ
jgi:hypothetical protein